MPLDFEAADAHVIDRWKTSIVPTLERYITIPNISPHYEPNWSELGYMDVAAELIRAWIAERPIEAMTVEVLRSEGRTPVVFAEIPAFPVEDVQTDHDTVLLYGHLDKQPPMLPWRDGLEPFSPVIEGDRLYGRGGADDGYSAFAAITAIEAVRAGGGAHARCVVLIEASEESGSPDLAHYVETLAARIGNPSLVVCLDSWAFDDRRLCLTTSLRGLVQARLRVDVLTEAIHSGQAGGIVPSSFRVLRNLLDRIEDSETGEVKIAAAHCAIPDLAQAELAKAAENGLDVRDQQPWADKSVSSPSEELLRAMSWLPALAVPGIGGAEDPATAGNILRPYTEASLALRLGPKADAAEVVRELSELLTNDIPEGATVAFTVQSAEGGWSAPPIAPWLSAAADQASLLSFGTEAAWLGIGGSIPFMAMLVARYPATQFVITGVLVPGSNAHGPNEFLHIPTAERVTSSVALILDAHASERSATKAAPSL